MSESAGYNPKPMIHVGFSIPIGKPGSTFYNKGQDLAKSASFFAQCSGLFARTKDGAKQAVMEKTKMTEAEFSTYFVDVPDAMTFTSDNIVKNLETLTATSEVLENVFNNVDNDQFWKEIGYWDSQATLAILEYIDVQRLPEDLKTKYQDKIWELVDPMLQALESEEMPDKESLNVLLDMLGSLLDIVNPKVKQALVSGDKDSVKQALTYISKDLMKDLADKIASYDLTPEKMEKVKSIKKDIGIQIANPAVGLVCAGIVTRAQSVNQNREHEVRQKCLEEQDKDKKRNEMESATKKRNEAKRAEKKRSKKNVASK